MFRHDVARFYAVNWWNAVATWNTVQAIRMAVAYDQATARQEPLDGDRAGANRPPRPMQAGTGGGSIWDRLAQCESSGDWGNVNPPYYGGLQFTLSSWRAVGGSGLPSDATAGEQIYRAQRLLDLQGPGAWPVCSYRAGLR